MYTMMEDPMTSWVLRGIVAFLPMCNGVMIVNREHTGETPAAWPSTLANTVGGGNVTPGFIGIGKVYITSKKFISADGGFKRVVWMPKALKETLAEQLEKRVQDEDIGDPDFISKIADEEVGTTEEEILPGWRRRDIPP